MAAVPHTSVEAIISCGINNYVFFEGYKQAKTIATEIFDNDFNACM